MVKQKSDFVTNSSSCSFIFVGWKMELSIENAMTIANVMKIEYLKESDIEDILDSIDDILNHCGIDIKYGDLSENGLESNMIYIGHYQTIDENYDTNEVDISKAIPNEGLIDTFGLKNLKIITGTAMN